MGQADDNKRSGSVREPARPRANRSDGAIGGYSYHHDESRVEILRGGVRGSTPNALYADTKPANDAAPARPNPGKNTVLGGFAAPDLLQRSTGPEPGARDSRSSLSDPPEVGSWPPMPSVPPELEGSADAALPARPGSSDDVAEMIPTDPPKATTHVSGAIWESVPSVLDSRAEPPLRAEGQASDDTRLEPTAPHRAQPADADRKSLVTPDAGDSRIARLDQLVERGAWEQLARELGSDSELTPTLQLLQVLARRELMPGDDKKGANLTREAIRALAVLLQVPESSPLALLVAKRLLRRNPVATHMTQASTGLSVTVLLAGLAVGAGAGWVLTRLFM